MKIIDRKAIKMDLFKCIPEGANRVATEVDIHRSVLDTN